jgi:Co/Zn/Cd efflux system component
MTPTDGLEDAVAQRLQSGGERLSDLHVWRVGPGAVSVIAAIVTDTPQPAEVYRRRLSDLTQVRHSTIEVIGL